MSVKALVGYDLMPGITTEDYDQWLWETHVPDLLANPHLDKIVFNTVIERVDQTSGGATPTKQTMSLYRVAELHYADMAAVEAYRAWFEEHPIPAERGPGGRSDFRFYVLCTVQEATREG
ncbi:MAG: hypothetical protein ACI867_002185 [Glaciecola sp.]|jgi:hypothetical protein